MKLICIITQSRLEAVAILKSRLEANEVVSCLSS